MNAYLFFTFLRWGAEVQVEEGVNAQHCHGRGSTWVEVLCCGCSCKTGHPCGDLQRQSASLHPVSAVPTTAESQIFLRVWLLCNAHTDVCFKELKAFPPDALGRRKSCEPCSCQHAVPCKHWRCSRLMEMWHLGTQSVGMVGLGWAWTWRSERSFPTWMIAKSTYQFTWVLEKQRWYGAAWVEGAYRVSYDSACLLVFWFGGTEHLLI